MTMDYSSSNLDLRIKGEGGQLLAPSTHSYGNRLNGPSEGVWAMKG
jgi:hypothetical protein